MSVHNFEGQGSDNSIIRAILVMISHNRQVVIRYTCVFTFAVIYIVSVYRLLRCLCVNLRIQLRLRKGGSKNSTFFLMNH